MALSGVEITTAVKEIVNEMKVRRSGMDHRERIKFVKFVICDGRIEVDEASKMKVKDFEGEADIYLKVISFLEDKECCYALYDCSYHTTETPKDELVFLFWADNCAHVKKKMLYSSSRTGLAKACLQGIKTHMQMTDEAEKDKSVLVTKLESNGVTVTEIEGIPL